MLHIASGIPFAAQFNSIRTPQSLFLPLLWWTKAVPLQNERKRTKLPAVDEGVGLSTSAFLHISSRHHNITSLLFSLEGFRLIHFQSSAHLLSLKVQNTIRFKQNWRTSPVHSSSIQSNHQLRNALKGLKDSPLSGP